MSRQPDGCGRDDDDAGLDRSASAHGQLEPCVESFAKTKSAKSEEIGMTPEPK